MQLSLTFVASALNDKHTVALRDAEGFFLQFERLARLYNLPTFSSVRLCTSGQGHFVALDNPSILYIVDESTVPTLPIEQVRNGIVYIGNYEPPRGCNAVWVSSPVDATDLYNELLDLFESMSAWAEEVNDTLLDRRPLADAVALFAKVTNNPFWYADAAMRVVYMSEDRGLSEFSPKWRTQYESGWYSNSTISTLVSSGDLEKLSINSKAWLFEDIGKTYTIPFTTKAVFVNGAIAGFLFSIQLHFEHCTRDLELSEYLGNVIANFIKHGDIGAQRTKHFCEQALRARLAGNEISSAEAEELLDMLSWSSAPGFIIAAFDRADKGDDMHEAPQVQVELLRKCLGFGQVFSYDAYVILFCSTEELSYDEIEREVGNACSMLGWKAGISDEFSDFASASTFYGQAQIALRKGQAADPQSSFYCYRDYGMSYISQKVALAMDEQLYLHPDIVRLLEHDEEKGSHLVETLRVHLFNERNITKTAADLDLHRNSVIYRMSTIEDLIGSDLDNDDNRFDLMLSLRIIESEPARCASRTKPEREE